MAAMGDVAHMEFCIVPRRWCVGLRPYMPLKEGGMRALPPEGVSREMGWERERAIPASVPMAMGIIPAPSAEPAPEDEPPG